MMFDGIISGKMLWQLKIEMEEINQGIPSHVKRRIDVAIV